jgi:hypothetical protein
MKLDSISESYINSIFFKRLEEIVGLPAPDQREKELIKLHGAFSGYIDTSTARKMLDKNLLKATKSEKDLLRKHFDSEGKLIPRTE